MFVFLNLCLSIFLDFFIKKKIIAFYLFHSILYICYVWHSDFILLFLSSFRRLINFGQNCGWDCCRAKTALLDRGRRIHRASFSLAFGGDATSARQRIRNVASQAWLLASSWRHNVSFAWNLQTICIFKFVEGFSEKLLIHFPNRKRFCCLRLHFSGFSQ